MEDPKAFERPAEGKVSDPDLRRLLRSVVAEEAAVDATEVAWRKPGRACAGRIGGAGGMGRRCGGSANESVEVGVLVTVLEVAAKRC